MSILILGAGQAAFSFAAKYRSLGGQSPISIFGDEAYLPYQRPPLSKKYLAGKLALEKLYFRAQSWYDDHQIAMQPNQTIIKIDRKAKTITSRATATHKEQIHPYDKLIIATGAKARPLPLPAHLSAPLSAPLPTPYQDEFSENKGAQNLYTIRAISDIDHIKGQFIKGRNLVIIGGGYIGLEAASIARQMGVNVTLIEAAPRILGRVADQITADKLRSLHQQNGVRFYEGQTISDFHFDKGNITAITLANGQAIPVDFMIAGIGIIPNDGLAAAAGLTAPAGHNCRDGIIINEYCQTNDADIYAAGDVSLFTYRGQLIRLENVGNAIDQGELIATNLANHNTAAPLAYRPKPWFWSEQYDQMLQIAGLNLGYDNVILRDHSQPDKQQWSLWYFKGDQLLAVDAMGDAKAYMVARKLIEGNKNIPKSFISNLSNDLKNLLEI